MPANIASLTAHTHTLMHCAVRTCPYWLLPQQRTPPDSMSTHVVLLAPTDTIITPVITSLLGGVYQSELVPSPSCTHTPHTLHRTQNTYMHHSVASECACRVFAQPLQPHLTKRVVAPTAQASSDCDHTHVATSSCDQDHCDVGQHVTQRRSVTVRVRSVAQLRARDTQSHKRTHACNLSLACTVHCGSKLKAATASSVSVPAH